MSADNENGWVSTQDIAEQFGTDLSNTRRWLIRAAAEMGIERISVRGRGGALMKVWAAADAERLIERRRMMGFVFGDGAPASVDVQPGGVFYLLQVDPDMPSRLKGGYSTNLEQRLASHRTIAPRLRLVEAWQCPAWAERPALAVLDATEGSERIGEEVFDVPLEAAIDRLGQFFILTGLAD